MVDIAAAACFDVAKPTLIILQFTDTGKTSDTEIMFCHTISHG